MATLDLLQFQNSPALAKAYMAEVNAEYGEGFFPPIGDIVEHNLRYAQAYLALREKDAIDLAKRLFNMPKRQATSGRTCFNMFETEWSVALDNAPLASLTVGDGRIYCEVLNNDGVSYRFQNVEQFYAFALAKFY